MTKPSQKINQGAESNLPGHDSAAELQPSKPKSAEKVTTSDPDISPKKRESGKLFTPGFASLIGVSFFGAANDNILKQILTMMVVVGGLWANRLGAGTQGIVFLVLSLPFIFLSGYAGQIADKYSKRDVILWVKMAEIPIALFALLGLLLGSFWMSLLALLMLAIQSSFYGPAKFGIIPDLVDDERLSQANGLLVGISNIAVIIGSLAAGPLADMYYPTVPSDSIVETVQANQDADPPSNTLTDVSSAESESSAMEGVSLVPDPTREPRRLPVGLVMFGVSCVGLLTVLLMPKLKAVAPDLKLSGDFFGPHKQTFRDANRPLIVVLFSWSGFYLIASLALLLLPDFRSILGVSNTAITNLIGLLAISIAAGSWTVGFLSGKTIRPYLSLIGAIGMTVCFLIMGLSPVSYIGLGVLVFFIGFFAGFYIVPLQALLQFLSPKDERGRFFGTANALSFVFISGAAVIYFVLAKIGLPPSGIALVCAALATVGTIVGAVELNRIMAARDQTHISFEESNEHSS